MTSYRFLSMEEQYVPAVLDIYNYYVEHSTATFHLHPLSADEMRQIVFFDNSRYEAFVILDEDTVCGYCILQPYHKREAYARTAEVTLYLRHDLTSRGLGGIAFDYLESVARERGIHVLIASICGENTGSIKLCEKKGYVQCAHLREVGMKFGRLLDVVYYQKMLDSITY